MEFLFDGKIRFLKEKRSKKTYKYPVIKAENPIFNDEKIVKLIENKPVKIKIELIDLKKLI